MPTTFNVFSLGVQADIDTVEGGSLAENAGALVGLTFGGVGDALLNAVVSFSPGTTGYTGGTGTAYDQDNAPAETFKIDGGTDQTFDAAAIYNATVTYIDGTTANVTAVIFQDTAGNTYFAPEFSANTDQAALEAGAIRSLTLNSISGASFSGLSGNRQTWNYVTCFVAGTLVTTPLGARPIEDLQVGDHVCTRDHGDQPIRWIGKSTVEGKDKLAPVRIVAGALGSNTPARDLLVSRQHRMLVSSPVCQRMFGHTEILVPAIRLTALPGVFVVADGAEVTYFHLMTDQHDIIFAEDAPSETLLAGPQAITALPKEALDELLAVFPDILETTPTPARPIERGKRIDQLILRHQRNDMPFVN